MPGLGAQGTGRTVGTTVLLAMPVALAAPAAERFGLDSAHLKAEVRSTDMGWRLGGREGKDEEFRRTGRAVHTGHADATEPCL